MLRADIIVPWIKLCATAPCPLTAEWQGGYECLAGAVKCESGHRRLGVLAGEINPASSPSSEHQDRSGPAAGARVTARCAAGKQDGMHRHPECRYRAELDMETLVWTRGRRFPLSRLETRLRCPLCGSRDVALIIALPHQCQRGKRSWPAPLISASRVERRCHVMLYDGMFSERKAVPRKYPEAKFSFWSRSSAG